jgi:hypothetical protein
MRDGLPLVIKLVRDAQTSESARCLVIDLFSKHHNRFDMNQIVTFRSMKNLSKDVSSGVD